MSAALSLSLGALLCVLAGSVIAWPFRHCLPTRYWLMGVALDILLRLSLLYMMPPVLSSALTLLAFTFFSRLAWFDIRTGKLPDLMTLPLLIAGLLHAVYTGYPSGPDAVLGACIGYLMLYTLDGVWRALTHQHAIGGGDMKLLAALGAWTGIESLLLLILCACLMAIGVGQATGRHRQPSATLPFGPFLIIAALVQLLLRYHWAPLLPAF